jgi:DNA-binding transcriptional LysR family regulator
MLSTRRLQIFVAVAEHGSFSAAATALTYTQSAVSQQMAQLEREAGTQLVARSSRGVTLTAAGEALLAHARELLALIDDAERDVKALAELKGGVLRMGAFASAWTTLIPRAAQAFTARYPGVTLELHEADALGDLDLALLTAPAENATALFDDPYRVVVPAGHPLATRERVTLDELTGETWVGEGELALEAEGWQALQGLVGAGLGIGLVPQLAVQARDDTAVLTLDGGPWRRVYAATRTPPHPAATAMIELLSEHAPQPAPEPRYD